jgi:hypothetical protein
MAKKQKKLIQTLIGPVVDQPMIYLAGPYTRPDPVANTRQMIKIAEALLRLPVLPVVPHLSLLWHLVRRGPTGSGSSTTCSSSPARMPCSGSQGRRTAPTPRSPMPASGTFPSCIPTVAARRTASRSCATGFSIALRQEDPMTNPPSDSAQLAADVHGIACCEREETLPICPDCEHCLCCCKCSPGEG